MLQFIKSIKNFITKRKYPYKETCPICNYDFRFMRYSGMSLSYPHFYCDSCSNVILRKSDFEKVMRNDISEDLLRDIVQSLPKCSCGGKFSSGNNPKCPHCKNEIRHQDTAINRLTDPYLIVMEGAKAYFK